MRLYPRIIALALLASFALTACKDDDQKAAAEAARGTPGGTTTSDRDQSPSADATLSLPAGSAMAITLSTPLTSETARLGDGWSGIVSSTVFVDGHALVPAGSRVTGVVSGVTPARRGDRAMLDLRLTSVTIDDRFYPLNGGTEAVIAGSPRARNLGAIAGAAAVGAGVGQAIGKNPRSTVIGGVVGAGAATTVVAGSKGWQVVLKPGTPMTFTTSEAVAVRS